ncbi:branched-chain amino acid ABC transporter ATPase [Frankia sp. R43]|uniref:branched-chain amino acid ABC transporter permease/ATP-binding protein n=1 Tax=Frankia sp. R43 TaxID=269536 RepID=UPI0006CA1F24|nr:branched-chain amino acid ABC transporter permease/ATP-binding protein [Frankia sp. R43]KPM51936.1 branched-chain amino acid ABC transporter ATPase [Frankia sp. R43]
MDQFLPFIVIGLASGAAYGLAGIGLVLTYKTSGILMFGYGAVAALDAFLFYYLHELNGMGWPIAAAIAVLVFAPLLGLLLEIVARSLRDANETVKVVSTVGVILLVNGISLLWHPVNPPSFDHFLPQDTVQIFSVRVTWEQIILFAVATAMATVLYWFFRRVRFGMVMRAVVDNGDLVAMTGDDPVRVRRLAWVIGSVFSGVAGLMLAPGQLVDGATMATLVFAAFGAAAIGAFTNLPLTFLGGLVVGVASALLLKYSATTPWLGGLPPALPFIILFLVLIVIPRRHLVQRRLVRATRAQVRYQAPARVRVVAGVIAVGLLAIVPLVQAERIQVWSAALINVTLLLSLGLLVRQSGQVSLCHVSLAAVGAAAFGHFATLNGLPWLVALLLAMLVAIPVAAIVAIPAVRVSGVFLALATLGFGILVEQVFYARSFMFGPSSVGIAAPRPHISIGAWDLSTDRGFYYVLLIFTALVALLLTAVGRTRLGRLLEAMSDSPLALETHGTTSSVLKVIVFCLSSALASLSGAFTAMLYHYGVSNYFVPFNSLILVVLVVIVTLGSPWYALIGAIGYTVIPTYITGQATTSVLNLLFGVGAVAAAFGVRAAGTPAPVRMLLEKFGGRGPEKSTTAASPAFVPAAPQGRHDRERIGLVLKDLHVRFGGVHAVQGASLEAPAGRITGLIGPNGAGKTTTFNACSGLVSPTSGSVFLHRNDVTRFGPAERARRGLGRTFQRTELFDSLTVRQNVAMGREAASAGRNPLSLVFASARSNRETAAATDYALNLTGLTGIADDQVGLLPSGQRRLVELARALAGPFDVILLDEPSSGLDDRETERFGEVLRTVTRERGIAILLVEHDMTLVRAVCDYVYVLDFGTPIFEGTPDEMHRSEIVRAAYLGDTALFLEPSE